MITYTSPVRPRVGKLLENGVGHIREKWVGKLPEKSGPKVGHFPENSQTYPSPRIPNTVE